MNAEAAHSLGAEDSDNRHGNTRKTAVRTFSTRYCLAGENVCSAEEKTKKNKTELYSAPKSFIAEMDGSYLMEWSLRQEQKSNIYFILKTGGNMYKAETSHFADYCLPIHILYGRKIYILV